MFRKSLLIGLSTAAMSVALASPAAAQNTQGGNCSPTTTSGTVTPGGNSCTLTRGAGADADNSTINVTGTTNTVTVTQNGLFDTSTVNIVGNANNVNHQQDGNFDQATTGISGNNNSASVFQGGSRQTATTSITGNFNSSSVFQQSGANSSTISTTISGGNIFAQAQQFAFGGAPSTNNNATLDLQNGVAGATGGALSQQGIINQSANSNTARLVIRGGSTAANGTNTGVIQQNNSLFQANAGGTDFVATPPTAANNPATLNNGDVSIAGNGQIVQIIQDGVRNFASASVSRGGVNVTAGGGGTQDGLTFQGGRREGNQLTVFQTGRNLSIQASVGGRDAAGFNGRGNIGQIQQGLGGVAPGGNQAATGTGGAASRDHSATLFQFGTLSDATVIQNGNVADGGASANAGGVQFGSVADVSQSAFASSINLTQVGSNTASLNQGAPAVDTGTNLSGNNTMNVTQVDSGDAPVAGTNPNDPFNPGAPGSFTAARNNVLTSQAGRGNGMTVNQNAVNASATVFQRRGTTSATVTLNQGSAQGFGQGAAAGPVAGASANLTANIEQSGRQTAGGRTVAVDVRQGGTNLTANVLQNAGVNFSTGTGLSVGVSQIGNRNSTTVNQSGSNAIATVDQRGTNTGATVTAGSASITQSGGVFGASAATDEGNRAIVRQFATAGRSTTTAGATFGGTTDTPGEGTGSRSGAQSAEAVIIQTVSGTGDSASGFNSATIEQSGLGQYAEISQSGRGNTAGISQGAAANNAVAIIRQSGNDNSFFITQNSANQFYRVVQTGGGNQTVTGTGTNGGITSNGFAPVGGPVAPGGF